MRVLIVSLAALILCCAPIVPAGAQSDKKAGKDPITLRGNMGSILSLVPSSDGTRLYSGGSDGMIILWELPGGKKAKELQGQSGEPAILALSADGKRLFLSSPNKTIQVLDLSSNKVILTLRGHTNNITSLLLSADGKRLYSGSYDKTVKVWDVEKGQELLSLRGHNDTVTSLAVAKDGKRLFSGSSDATIKVWDLPAGTEAFTLRGHNSDVLSLALSPDGKRLYSGGWDATLKVWDTSAGKETLTLRPDGGQVQTLLLSADGKRLFSGQRAKAIADLGVIGTQAADLERLINVRTFSDANAQAAFIHTNGSALLRALTAEQTQLAQGQCTAFGSCFAAGTKLLTPAGCLEIECFRVGDSLLSRSEFDPDGLLETKLVEQIFVRTGKIFHLHVNGQVIRTTEEHPFWVKEKGWIRADDLQPGDSLSGHDGQWVAVEEVYDTGEWETVYNLRISDYHTYFVSGEDWGFSVWSHNTSGACDGPPSGNLTADTLRVLQERLDGTPKRTVVLRGDANYTILGGSAHYYTNADGQLSRVAFNLTQQTGRNGPAGNTTWMGRLGTTGDQGGHILGKQFNGSNQYPNLVPMNAGINAYPVPQNDWNGGAYGYLESFWSSALAHHRNVSNVSVQLDYPTVESLRPSRFVLNFTIGGNPFEFPLRNSASQTLPTEQDMQRLREAIGVE